MILGKRSLGIVFAVIAGLLVFLWPVVWAYGSLLYMTVMPIERVELVSGRNALFLTLMKGRYCLRVSGVKCGKSVNSVSVNGHVKTSTSTNAVNKGECFTSSDASYCLRFECNGNVERVEVILDVDWPTNSVDEVSVVVFPCK